MAAPEVVQQTAQVATRSNLEIVIKSVLVVGIYISFTIDGIEHHSIDVNSFLLTAP